MIETPDRAPEVPNTVDKAFIKGSGESSSLGGPSADSEDPDYELTISSGEESSEDSPRGEGAEQDAEAPVVEAATEAAATYETGGAAAKMRNH